MGKLRIQKNDVSQLCILAGQIMLESGAETYRVEDTMLRIAYAFGVDYAESYVAPTVIIFSIDGGYSTRTEMKRIEKRGTNLNKIALVNQLSREISAGMWTLEEAFEQLRAIQRGKIVYPLWLQVIAAGLVSGFCVILFKGSWEDFLPGLVIGSLSYYAFILLDHMTKLKFFSEFTAAILIGVLSHLAIHFGIGHQMDKIVIGSVMPLVPGLLITNAIRDLMAGHLVSGLSKGTEALLTAFAIGSGIAIVLQFIK